MNKSKYQLGQTVKTIDGKGIVSKIFETTIDGYLYEVLINGEYLLYLEKELNKPEDTKKSLKDMSKEELLQFIETYSNYVDINSKMLKVSIMNASDYINSNKYKDLCNQKEEIKEISNVSIDETSNKHLFPWDLDTEAAENSLKKEEPSQKIHTDFFIPSDKYMRENAHNICKFDINDLKRGDKVIILTSNLKGTIVEIDRHNKIILVFVPSECKTYGANIGFVRKIKEL